MSRIIRYKEMVEVTTYSMVFAHEQKYGESDIPPGGWYGFDCDKDGNVDRDKLNPCARANFDYCCLMRPWGHIAERKSREMVPGLMKCDCGEELEMYRPGADIHCRCRRSYNSAGQLLAPRSQWGEETGETAQDYDRGFSDPEHAFDE